MLDSIQTKVPVESSPQSRPLINSVQDDAPISWSQIKAGFVAGLDQSMHDGTGHLVRDGATTAVAVAAGKFGSVYSRFGSKMPLLVGTAVLVTALSRGLDEKPSSREVSDFDFGKGVGRFLADVTAATGLAYLGGREMWRKEGSNYAEYLVSKQSDWRYVPAHRSTYGPKMYSFGSHYEHTGLTLKEKTRELQDFLRVRGESSQLSELLPRMKELHNPKIEGHVWTTKRLSI